MAYLVFLLPGGTLAAGITYLVTAHLSETRRLRKQRKRWTEGSFCRVCYDLKCTGCRE